MLQDCVTYPKDIAVFLPRDTGKQIGLRLGIRIIEVIMHHDLSNSLLNLTCRYSRRYGHITQLTVALLIE